jgi:hypothetical protein
MFKTPFLSSFLVMATTLCAQGFANSDPLTPKDIQLATAGEKKAPARKVPPSVKAAFSPFTGKIVGEKVRMRLHPDAEGYIVRELTKNEMVTVADQEGDFYAIEPPEPIKAFIFRSFVIDNVVEGNRVNVRLEPDLESPVIGHLNSGDRIDGVVSSSNRKWLEIAPPQGTRFYIAKDFIEYAGGPDLKEKVKKRGETVRQLLDAANAFAEAEMDHPFEEINFEKVKQGYLAIAHEYSDFPKKVEQAKEALAKIQDVYLEKRIAYLEAKAALAPSEPRTSSHTVATTSSSAIPMRSWTQVEEGLYLSWAQAHDDRSKDEFYEDQKMASTTLTGVLESFKSPIKNKPGDYLVKNKNLPVAYIYSTKVDLEQYVGKKVTLTGAPRPNHNFAFPAYYILDVE